MKKNTKQKKYFGGQHLVNKRKLRRPLDTKKPMHLVLRLKEQLPSLFSPKDPQLRKGFHQLAEKYNIKTYLLVFNHTHVHAEILIPDRKSYVRFIRELTSRFVRYFTRSTGIRFTKIFENRPFTRIISWGRGVEIMNCYMRKNERESGVKQVAKGINSQKQRSEMNQFEFLFDFQI